MDINLFYNLPIEDQQQYYGKTHFRIFNPKTESFNWSYCWGFTDQSEAKMKENDAKQGFREITRIVDFKERPPNFDFPKAGLYNLRNSTLLFNRIPRRQSRKGLCVETAEVNLFESLFKDVNPWINSKFGLVLSLREIIEMFDSPFDFSLSDAFLFFKKKKPISFALNRDFGLSLGITGKYLSLWYKQILIGEVPSPKTIVLLSNGLFQQEAIDHFSKEDIKFEGVNL